MQIGGGDSLSIPPARHGVGVDENEAVFLTILPARNSADRPRLQIGTVNPEPVDIDRACRAVSDGVAKGLSRVVLLADGQVPHGEMLGIISEITKRESGATIHIGVKDPE
jgi:biopolymer transport protein ExbD